MESVLIKPPYKELDENEGAFFNHLFRLISVGENPLMGVWINKDGTIVKLRIEGDSFPDFPPVYNLLKQIGQFAPLLLGLHIRIVPLLELPMEWNQLKNLEWAILQTKSLHIIPPKIGKEWQSLQDLTLYTDALEALPDGLFAPLAGLTRCELGGARLASLPASLWGCLHLRALAVRDAPALAALPAGLGNLRALEALTLARTGVAALPESLGALGMLERLALEASPLASLPDALGQLALLERLALKGLPLAALPASIGGCHALRWLAVEDCPNLRQLPDAVAALPVLEELQIHRCAVLGPLPDALPDAPRLRSLDFRHNPKMTCPAGFWNRLDRVPKVMVERCGRGWGTSRVHDFEFIPFRPPRG